MFKKIILLISTLLLIYGCTDKVSTLHKKDIKETIPVSRQKDSFDPYCGVGSDGKTQTCLEVYAPVLFISGSYGDPKKVDYEPKEINSMLNESDLYGPEVPDRESDKIYDYKEVITSSLDIKSLWYKIIGSDRFVLNMRDADPGYLFYLVPDPSRFNDHYKTMVYGREALFESKIEKSPSFVKYRVLQYFFFYPYNNWLNHHEGDWEMIQVILDENTKSPIKITYSWHYGGSTFDWNDSRIEKVAETHPVVYVASGSHASYWSKGDHKFSQFGIPCSFTDHADPVKTLVPSGSGIKSLDIQEDLRDLPQAFYVLSGNIDQIPWTRWGGYWGETEIFSISGSSGPQGPYYQSVDKRYFKWKNPVAYANRPISSHYSVCARSPVKLYVHDLKNNFAGRTKDGKLEVSIPGLYIYSPDDKQMVLVTSEDLVFKIEAVDKGEFDFGFTRYQNEVSTVTDVSYHDVQVTNKTIATVHVTKDNPEYKMEIDLDGDGNIDRLKIPDPRDVIVKKIPVGDLDENVNQVPFPVEEDRDGDAIFDLVDNCIGKFNPDQRDIDGNGLGDACDYSDNDGNIYEKFVADRDAKSLNELAKESGGGSEGPPPTASQAYAQSAKQGVISADSKDASEVYADIAKSGGTGTESVKYSQTYSDQKTDEVKSIQTYGDQKTEEAKYHREEPHQVDGKREMGQDIKYSQETKLEKTDLTIYREGKKGKDLSYNPLNDPNLGRELPKKIDISKLIANFQEQQPGPQKEDSGNIGGGDYPTDQSDSYTKGTIGKPTPPVQVDDDQKDDGVKTAAVQPDDQGTGGLSNVTVDRQNITLTFWDHGTEDGDIINIYLNNRLIKGNLRLKKSKRSFPVQLNSGKNRFVVEAVNEGTVSPNTASVRISNVTSGKALQIYERRSGKKASMRLTAP